MKLNNSFVKKILLISAIVIMNSTMVFAVVLNDTANGTSVNVDTNDKEAVYLQESKNIKTDIYSLNVKIKEINDYNSEVNNKLDELSELYKIDKSIITNDTMRKIREIRKTIKDTVTKEKNIIEDESINSLVQRKEYDKALERLNGILEEKKAQYKEAEERNTIWKQIDLLIS